MRPPAYFRPAPLEVAGGCVPGVLPRAARPDVRATARACFEQAVLTALVRTPCCVAFSGGRDSSAVLAVATQLARREGLPDPVPIIVRYPGDADAEETAWQDLVLDHLGVEPVVLAGGAGKDALGVTARQFLLEHGLLWPAFLHDKQALLDVARGGSLVTGDGGDEVLGAQRISPVRVALSRRRLDGPATKAVLYAAAPPRLRRQRLRRAGWGARSWLTPAASKELLRRLHDDEARTPLSWPAGVRRQVQSRGAVLGLQNYRALGTASNVTVSQPFLDPAFVSAFAAGGTFLGPTGRTRSMRSLFEDVLPDAVLTRTSKATFNTAAFGPGARDFVASWCGEGVDPALVNAEALAREWEASAPHAGTFLLLQQAWLATQDSP